MPPLNVLCFYRRPINPTRGLKDIARTQKCDEQTDIRTDNEAKSNMSPHFMEGDITMITTQSNNMSQYAILYNNNLMLEYK